MRTENDFCIYTWSGEVEVRMGDIGDQMCEAWIEYETDGNIWRLVSHKLTRHITNKLYLKDGKSQFHEHLIEDITESITEKAVEDIFDEYIVQEGL